MKDVGKRPGLGQPEGYQIKVQGRLTENWSDWFSGMTIACENRSDGAPITTLTGAVATGRVKVLHTPREKPVEKGDVLVAYTTDPGWTPLFVNATAILLEVGGMLQHGGVVAREYGKPCVAGIQGITTTLQDGQLVVVDGTTGVVRLLE
jgi:phosphoenolpyruvate synthase/pyruvate phosphate dikinase